MDKAIGAEQKTARAYASAGVAEPESTDPEREGARPSRSGMNGERKARSADEEKTSSRS